MSLSGQLSAVYEGFLKNAPEPVKNIVLEAKSNFQASFKSDSAIQTGDTLPPFSLSNALGQTVDSFNLLAKGPLLISFYRGEWCPFCNIALRELQKHLNEFEAKGVTLVAISPQLADASLSTAEKNALKFTVLSDVGNEYAKKLGILFQQPDALRPIFDKVGHDLKGSNGDDSFIVPVPATLLVDEKGVVRNTFIDPDYTKRVEPSAVLQWIEAL